MDWSALGRILIMSKQGCVAKFLKFQRFYTWDELAIKRYENYRYMLGNGSKERFSCQYDIRAASFLTAL